MRIVLAFACSETSAAWMVAEMAVKITDRLVLVSLKN